MRRMLGILGTPTPSETSARDATTDPLAPMPGFDRLGELLEQVRAAGLAGRARGRGRSAPARPRHRAVGLPNHPGGADEHAQARPRRPRAGPRPLRADASRDIDVTDRGGTGDRGIGVPAHESAVASSGCVSGSRCSVVGSRLGRCLAGSASRCACRSLQRRPPSDGLTVPIRVLLVDDQELVRTGFRMILADEADIEVVGEAADGARRGRRLSGG